MKQIYSLTLFLFVIAQSHAQGMWTQKANFGGTARYNAVGFSIGTKGYIGTGYDGYSQPPLKQDFWEWDQTTNVWTQMANFGGTSRYNAVGFSIGSKGYIGTGDTSGGCGCKNDFWEYDPSLNMWTQKANFGGGARSFETGFSIGTKGYIGLGLDSAVFNNAFWEWNQASNVWTQAANFGGTARQSAVGFSIGTKGYIGTGFDGATTNDFWEYDQASNTWSQKANFGGTGRCFAVGFSIDTKGYIGTGMDWNSSDQKDFWEWNQATNLWIQRVSFGGTARAGAVGFSIGNKGYIGTGKQDSPKAYEKDFWEYTPDSTVDVNELTNSVVISVYPNPFSSQATFIFNSELKDAQLKLFDVSGKEVREIVIPSGARNLTVERNNLESGIYFYRLTLNPSPQGEGREIATGKIIISP